MISSPRWAEGSGTLSPRARASGRVHLEGGGRLRHTWASSSPSRPSIDETCGLTAPGSFEAIRARRGRASDDPFARIREFIQTRKAQPPPQHQEWRQLFPSPTKAIHGFPQKTARRQRDPQGLAGMPRSERALTPTGTEACGPGGNVRVGDRADRVDIARENPRDILHGPRSAPRRRAKMKRPPGWSIALSKTRASRPQE